MYEIIYSILCMSIIIIMIMMISIKLKVPANIPPLCCGAAGAGAEYEGAWAGGGADFAAGAGADALLAY